MKKRISLFLCVLVATTCLLTAGVFAETFIPDGDGVYTVSMDAQPDNEYFMVVLKGEFDQTNYIEAYNAADDGDILYFEQKSSGSDGIVTFGPFVPNGYYASTVIVGGTDLDDPVIAGYLSVTGVSNTASIDVQGVENSYTVNGVYGRDYVINVETEVLDSFGYPSVTDSEASLELAGNLDGVSIDGSVITISKTAKEQTFQVVAKAGTATKVIFVDVKRDTPFALGINFYSDDTYTETVSEYRVLGTLNNYPDVTVYAKTYDQYLDETKENYTYTYFGSSVGATFTPKAGNKEVYLHGVDSGVQGSVLIVADTRHDYKDTALELYNLINACKDKLFEEKNVSVDGTDVFSDDTWTTQENVDTFAAAINTANKALASYNKEGYSDADYADEVEALTNALSAYNASFKAGIRVDVETISIKEYNGVMLNKTSLTLEAVVYPRISADQSNDVLTWTSSDETVVKIDSLSGKGNTKAVIRSYAGGNATVTVTTRGGLTASAEITVIQQASNINYTATSTVATFRSEPVVLNAKISPKGCTDIISWSIDRPELAELADFNEYVDENGYRNIKATVIPKESGKVKISVNAKYGEITQTKEITIKMPTWDTAAAPYADVESGSILSGTKVSLASDTENTQIYYTLDGTEPSRTNGRLYKNPIVINQNLTLKAVAVGEELYDSAVAVYKYNVVASAVRASSGIARRGDDIDITISVEDLVDIKEAVINISFDNTVLDWKDTEFLCGHIDELKSSLGEPEAKVVLNYKGDGTQEAFSYDGDVIRLTFKVSEEAEEGEYGVSVSAENILKADGSTYDAAAFDGTVVVNDYIIGDANNDGTIGLADVLIIKQYLADNEAAKNSILLVAADVDGDGDVDNDDVVLLSKYCTGWDVTLG